GRRVELAAIRTMAAGAVLGVDRLAARRLGLVDLEDVLRWFERQQPCLEPADRREIDSRRRGAGAERCVLVALFRPDVVAVPVQLHALARLLQPDRGKVDWRVALSLWQRTDREVEQDLVRIEGVVAPRSPLGVL